MSSATRSKETLKLAITTPSRSTRLAEIVAARVVEA
jgi:hypothetical protein